MQTNLKSVLAVGAVVGLICVAAYPIVVVRMRLLPSAAVSAAAAAAAAAAACSVVLMRVCLLPPNRPLASVIDALQLAVLQVPLKDRSTREAPAGGFAKGAPAALSHRTVALHPCITSIALYGSPCAACRRAWLMGTSSHVALTALSAFTALSSALSSALTAGSMWKSIDAAAKAKDQQ